MRACVGRRELERSDLERAQSERWDGIELALDARLVRGPRDAVSPHVEGQPLVAMFIEFVSAVRSVTFAVDGSILVVG